MRQSLYTYCYGGCPLDFFSNNTHLGVFGGVVGVDHYWTQQVRRHFCADRVPRCAQRCATGPRVRELLLTESPPRPPPSTPTPGHALR
jgi:hypothetical protein